MPMNPRLLRPAQTGFSPRSISGLELWLNAADSSSLTLNGSTVSQWNDLSGKGRNATQSTAASQPSATATLNGRPAVGGNSGWMTIGAFPLVYPATVFAVTSLPGGNSAVFQAGSLNQVYSLLASLVSGEERMQVRRSSAAQSQGVYVPNSQMVVTAFYNTNLSRGRISGVSLGADNTATVSPTAGDYAWTILRLNSTTFPSNVILGELLLYNRVLAAADFQRVEGYLAWKWGLQAQLPYDHPYARSFPGYGSQAVPTDADTLTYLAAVKAADGTGVEVGVANAVDAFVRGCKQDQIWDAIKSSCILSGARTLSGALTPLKGTAPTNNGPFVSGDYNRETGLVGNGSTKYLDANRAGTDDPLTSSHFSVFASTAETTNFGAYIGTNSALSNDNSAIGRANTALVFNNRNVNSLSVASVGTATGFIGTSRASSTAMEGRVSGATTSLSQTAGNRSSINFFVYGVNTGTLSNAGNSRLAFYSIGEAVDLALLDSRVSALITAIGAAIP